MEEENKVVHKWYFYVCCFFVYCIIGWIYEATWEACIGHGFYKRGFLYGPYLPIYGFGFLMLYFPLKKLIEKKVKIKKIDITPIITFIAILLLVSVVEYISSFLMEVMFHKRWWDYSNDLLNINGRVSFRNSSILAIGGMFFLYLVQPFLRKIFSKIKPNILKTIAIIIISVISIDFVCVILGYL